MDPEPRPRRRPPSSTSGSARGLQQPLGGDGAPGSARPGERNHSPARCGCVRRRGRRCGRSGQRPGRGSRPSAPRAPSSEDRVAPAPRSVNSAVAFGQKQENRDLEKVLRRLNSLCGSREQNEDQLAEPSRRQPPQGSCWLKKDLRTDRSPPTPSRRALSPAEEKPQGRTQAQTLQATHRLGTRVRALVWEDPTCRRATKPVSHNY
ncbi:uncharacterized protein LOC132362587 isoform X3 [Balaenoptera ricei]|uniref:uncharacterized protein LOC132362587 isoform X3 n=1 Tax=Balaenoptera ricei TaxID=2746895 RepID=UPI0028BE2496|nr:uncharacterized protein LOC132362587 isoform X3 [Balaenoptera ricei]